MPLVTITVRKPKSPSFKTTVLDAVDAALVSNAGVPPTNVFQRVLELKADDFRFDPTYPDAASPRNNDFVLIELFWSVGGSIKVKKKLLEELMSTLSNAGLEPDKVVLVFKETTFENWSFAGGRILHA